MSVQTNPRYKHFKQEVFHAGDESQFLQHCRTRKEDSIDMFRYIFHKFKKGIFVKILDNKVEVFLPFSKSNYTNEWSQRVRVSDKFRNVVSLFKYVSESSGFRFDFTKVQLDSSKWYANNGIIRYENPINENDTNVNCLKHMIETLCSEREMEDVEFFINKRDFPLIKKDCTEPYNNIWGSKTMPLVSHLYNSNVLLLSMVSNRMFGDVAIATHDDWSNICNDSFNTSRVQSTVDMCEDWDEKIPTAVFRGSSTGIGVTVEDNKRLKLCMMSFDETVKDGECKMLDAGITKWNLRPRMSEENGELDTIHLEAIPFDRVECLTLSEQSTYKYIVNVEGHVASFRLSSELTTLSVVLIVDCEWDLWYKSKLIPYEHYVPIKSDLSDLFEMIEWCRTNDDKCKHIAQNALQFSLEHLSKKSILDDLQQKLNT